MIMATSCRDGLRSREGFHRAEQDSDDEEAPQGGYHDVDFIDQPPDSLQCPVCLSALKQPHILSCCGKHMCEVSYTAVVLSLSRVY